MFPIGFFSWISDNQCIKVSMEGNTYILLPREPNHPFQKFVFRYERIHLDCFVRVQNSR